MSTAPDMRPESDDPSPKASRGKAKPDANAKAADTWVSEAISNARRSRDYFGTAAAFYEKAGLFDKAKAMKDMSDSIHRLLMNEAP